MADTEKSVEDTESFEGKVQSDQGEIEENLGKMEGDLGWKIYRKSRKIWNEKSRRDPLDRQGEPGKSGIGDSAWRIGMGDLKKMQREL
jgi:hypothetical protein